MRRKDFEYQVKQITGVARFAHVTNGMRDRDARAQSQSQGAVTNENVLCPRALRLHDLANAFIFQVAEDVYNPR